MESLELAIENGNVDEILTALESVPTDWYTINDEFGQSIVQRVCEGGNFEVLKELVDKLSKDKVDLINYIDSEGASLLHLACRSSSKETVEYILKICPSLENVKDNEGATSLHWASTNGYDDIVDILNNGINEQDKVGCTPLHYAASMNRSGCVDLLLKKGADKTIKNQRGQLPIDLAKQRDYFEVIDMLR
eukprot:TRINITY_DN6085_c0_g1_i1.p1 TRINITY_DN6085_c0_g1~~TRINITY_DN6085_c0_g1_i1.p1  ORF type:complete len:191 (+),score=32.46 TRINITY_DN6085_c0_g1_i1:89-661(+)